MNPQNSYVKGIDGLRAVAVLSVIIFHFDHQLLPGGFTGVDVFFVISGYVISKSLAANFDKSFSKYILDFYKRRIIRIMPAVIFFLVVTSIVSTMFIPQFWLSSSNEKTSLWAFFGLSNFALVLNADGYFDMRIPFNPFVHTWSLAVEEQFYLIFPVIFYLYLLARQRGARALNNTVLLLPLLAIASFGFSAYETGAHPERAFYLLPSRFWQLSAGAMLFQVHSHGIQISRGPISNTVLLLTGCALLTIGFVASQETEFPFPWAVIPVAGSILLIAALSEEHRSFGLNRVFEAVPCVYIGRISFSLYLWHWPVFTLFRWTVGMEGILTGLLSLMISFGLAVFSYTLVESPIRRSSLIGKSASLRIVAAVAALTWTSYFATSQIYLRDHFPNFRLSITEDACVWSPGYTGNCENKMGSTNLVPTGAQKTILMAGDSHAGAYRTMVYLAAEKIGASVEFFAKPGCSIANFLEPQSPQICGDLVPQLIDFVETKTKPGDIVFLASLRMPRFGDQWAQFDVEQLLSAYNSPEMQEARSKALREADELVNAILALDRIVLIDAPKPIFKTPLFRCSDWFNASNPICRDGFTVSRATLDYLRDPILESLHTIQKKRGIHIWDAFPLLCPGEVCSAFHNGKPIVSDGDHLSGYGNRLLVNPFTEKLIELWTDSVKPMRQIDLTERIGFIGNSN